MKAMVYHAYGPPDVLRLEEVPTPVPADDEVLIQTHAASLNAYDWRLLRADPFLVRLQSGWFFKPKYTILGADIAGRVEAVGRNVTQFKPGDEVYGDMAADRNGGFAEYVCARASSVALKPANLSFAEAAAAPMAAVTALQGLRDQGRIQAGKKALINGASGGVGTFAVQIAKAMGAEVTAVCSPRNVELIRSLGADRVVDYTREDFTRSGQRYDLLLDIAGSRTWYEYKRVLTPGANFVIVGGPKFPVIGPLRHIAAIYLTALGASQKVTFFIAKFNLDDFYLLNEWFENGKVSPVVEKVYPLAQISEAMRRLGAGHAQGKIVVRVS